MSDFNRTIVTGGRGAASPPPFPDQALLGASSGGSPILATALPILSLAPRLRTASEPQGLASLDARLAELVHGFEQRARSQGGAPAAVDAAAWALSALFDDLILNTPWGGHGRWAPRSLVAARWRQVDAGDRFYDHLRELSTVPDQNLDLLRLMHLCLLLGFEGRYRARPDLRPTRAEVTATLGGLIGHYLPAVQAELSPRWRGTEAPLRPRGTSLPLWAMGVAGLVVLALVYLGFRQQLAANAEGLDTAIAALPPPAPVRIARGSTPVPPPPPPATPQREQQTATRLRLNLGEIARFRPGSAELDPASHDRILALVPRLDAERGLIRVIGHTDDTPIRNGRFASNDELSRARAVSVAQVLQERLTDPDRVRAEGRGAREPLDPQITEAARARNRRIEIVVERGAAR